MSEGAVLSDPSSLEAALLGAPDSAFRARATTEYRRIRNWVAGNVDLDRATILDFGCGEGVPAVSFALRHPKAQVIGTDILEVSIDRLERLLWSQSKLKIPDNIEFFQSCDDIIPGDAKFDFVYAWSVINHIDRRDVDETLGNLRIRMNDGGIFFVQVEPLYYSSSGSLLYRYFPDPWHHLILPISAMRERVLFEGAGDREMREWQQFLELNRMTADEIVSKIEHAGFEALRVEVQRSEEQPPEFLALAYHREILTARGFQAMFRKI